ncbi:MAG: hypothetical protein DRH26_01380 [Deltaproteobacteria bacterium]|nr:MAG: hypothetical protein DRH26_01380 [Deltaproteobacteria bacterium]
MTIWNDFKKKVPKKSGIYWGTEGRRVFLFKVSVYYDGGWAKFNIKGNFFHNDRIGNIEPTHWKEIGRPTISKIVKSQTESFWDQRQVAKDYECRIDCA